MATLKTESKTRILVTVTNEKEKVFVLETPNDLRETDVPRGPTAGRKYTTSPASCPQKVVQENLEVRQHPLQVLSATSRSSQQV